METRKKIAWVTGIAAVLVLAGIVVYPKLVVTLPNDGADAKPYTFKAVRGQRYTEMFLIGGNAITKDLSANVYNTTGLNGGATTGNSCPAAILDKVDVKDIRQIFESPKLFSAANALSPIQPPCADAGRILTEAGVSPVPTMTNVDPPAHTRVRRLANAAFKPKRVAAMEPFVRELVVRFAERQLVGGAGRPRPGLRVGAASVGHLPSAGHP